MPIAAVLLAAIGAFLIKEVVSGRSTSTIKDAKSFGSAVLNFDMASAASVLTDTSSTAPASVGSADAGAASDWSGPPSNNGEKVLLEAQTLGTAAKGYQIGGTGPDYYDCSGLVWKALKETGIYNGSRFTTASFDHIASQFATKVTSPQVGDIANSASHGHMGIVNGSDSFYSAMNPDAGIGSAPLSQFHDSKGEQITDWLYWRVK